MRSSAIFLIVFFLVLVSPPFFLSVRFGKRFDETVALSAGSVILILFLFGILGVLEAGVFFVLGLTLLLIGLSMIRESRDKEIKTDPDFGIRTMILLAIATSIVCSEFRRRQ